MKYNSIIRVLLCSLCLMTCLGMLLSFTTIHNNNTNTPIKNNNSKELLLESSSQAEFTASSKLNYTLSDQKYAIHGNYQKFDKELLHTLTHNQSVISIFYDLDISDNENTDLEILRNNVVIYYYKDGIPHIHSYISNSLDEESLMNDINSYVNEKLSKINEDKPRTVETESDLFAPLYVGSFRKEHKPYGYVDCDYTVNKYRANDVSSLYLVESDCAFVPGKVAQDLGSSNYSAWYNSSGYMKIRAHRAENEVGYGQIRYGGTPIYKDAFPINAFGSVSIVSSYTQSLNLGYSCNNGFSLYDANVEIGSTSQSEYVYHCSRTYQNTEPALSAQKDPSDVQKYTWLYTYSSPRNEAFHLLTGYIFEMNNSGHNLLEGDLALNYEYRMTVSNNLIASAGETYLFTGSSYHNYY